jgi:hypothetical protein
LLITPAIKSFLHANRVLGDGITDVDALALNETIIADSIGNLFDDDPLLDSAHADAAGVRSFGANKFTATATDSSGSTSAASAPVVVTVDTAEHSPLTINAAPPVTAVNGASVEIDGVSVEPATFACTTASSRSKTTYYIDFDGVD